MHTLADETGRELRRTGKAQGAPRWSLFLFFRIISEIEMRVFHEERVLRPDEEAWPLAKSEIVRPGHNAPGLARQAPESVRMAEFKAALAQEAAAAAAGGPPDVEAAAKAKFKLALGELKRAEERKAQCAPSRRFLDWLKVVSKAEGADLRTAAESFIKGLGASPGDAISDPLKGLPNLLKGLPDELVKLFESKAIDLPRIARGLNHALAALTTDYDRTMQAVLEGMWADVGPARRHPLPMLLLYEMLRQAAPAFRPKHTPSSARVATPEIATGSDPDRSPFRFGFTYSGLQALKVDGLTLSSFPDVFKEGMAARAARLHDTGPSAPETWDGALGLKDVHGYFTGGFRIEEPVLPEAFWEAIRADVRAFNEPVDEDADLLRFAVALLFRAIGLEIVHVELGQDPYDVEADVPKATENREEHFGFRDGLSQPFVDLGLGAPAPGGATPAPNGTWTPVATGEIYLSGKDEDGLTHRLPVSSELREGSTFLVFRKLEQDVVGFRQFLGAARPGDEHAQTRLAAQFLGRWQDGTSLVKSPDAARATSQPDEDLNNFRYDEDPNGLKCPLSAHVRRANPRDSGGRDEARRHRILRRGISYGGRRLPKDSPGDPEPRGLLFVAANARIDLQFEVIQSSWINGGEFLGQVGLGRCPMTGAHSGRLEDSFLEAGAVAPVTNLPRFVTTRGGDYFFAPGPEVLKKIADGETFDAPELVFGVRSMGDARSCPLLDPKRLEQYAELILNPTKPGLIRVKTHNSGAKPDSVVFVGRYHDVTAILSGTDEKFSVQPFAVRGSRMTHGGELLVGTDEFGATENTRRRMLRIAHDAWTSLETAYDGPENLEKMIRKTARVRLNSALERLADARRVDLLDDLAVPAIYSVMVNVLGAQGPIEDVEVLKGERELGLKTMQTWSVGILAELSGNFESIKPIQDLARERASGLLNHILELIQSPKQRPHASETNTLISFFHRSYLSSTHKERYLRDSSLFLLEILGATLAVIPVPLAKVMEYLLDNRIDLATLSPHLTDEVLERLICEAERLNSALPARMRRCEKADACTEGGSGPIYENEFVAVLVAAANVDPQGKFGNEPLRFSLSPGGPIAGPDRNIEDYLMFGPWGGRKTCWGRDRVAMPIMKECILAYARLKGLRRMAGPAGAIGTDVGVTTRFPARFTTLLPSRGPGSDAETPADLAQSDKVRVKAGLPSDFAKQ